MNLPWILVFHVDYPDLNGTFVRLYGEAAREGEAKPPSAGILIPAVGCFTRWRRRHRQNAKKARVRRTR